MQNQIKDSIKARLYDFKYTPFLSAYLFSWAYWNSKLLLIFTAPKLSVNDKIDLLAWADINYKYPLYFALAYVFIFPLATTTFYAATLGYKVLMNWVQQKIQDKTPLPLEHAQRIRSENIRLEIEHRKIADELERVRQDYLSKETALTEEKQQQKELFDTTLVQRVQEQTKKLNQQINDLVAKDKKQDTRINEDQETINQLQTELTKLKPNDQTSSLVDKAHIKAQQSQNELVKALTIDQIKILAVFFENDSSIGHHALKNYAAKTFKLSKVLSEQRIKEIIETEIMSTNNFSYHLKERGATIIEKIFG